MKEAIKLIMTPTKYQSSSICQHLLIYIKSLQQLLGMTQYLSKFLPHLSAITEPLRQLGHKDTEWKWLEVHDKAVSNVKDLICKAPVLRYFDPAIEIFLQCSCHISQCTC